MSKLEPVEGWKAHRTKESYHIMSCPNFVPAPNVPEDKEHRYAAEICPECGKTFMKKLVQGGARKYCSVSCQGRAAKARRLARIKAKENAK